MQVMFPVFLGYYVSDFMQVLFMQALFILIYASYVSRFLEYYVSALFILIYAGYVYARYVSETMKVMFHVF